MPINFIFEYFPLVHMDTLTYLDCSNRQSNHQGFSMLKQFYLILLDNHIVSKDQVHVCVIGGS